MGKLIQTIVVEFTTMNGEHKVSEFIDEPLWLERVSSKLAFIVECYLFDHEVDLTKPVTIKYIPNPQPSE